MQLVLCRHMDCFAYCMYMPIASLHSKGLFASYQLKIQVRYPLRDGWDLLAIEAVVLRANSWCPSSNIEGSVLSRRLWELKQRGYIHCREGTIYPLSNSLGNEHRGGTPLYSTNQGSALLPPARNSHKRYTPFRMAASWSSSGAKIHKFPSTRKSCLRRQWLGVELLQHPAGFGAQLA